MFNSIRWSLQLWHAGLLAAVLAVFGMSSYYGISRGRYNETDIELERSVQLLTAGLHYPPPPGPPRWRMNQQPNGARNFHDEAMGHRPGPPDWSRLSMPNDEPQRAMNQNRPAFGPRDFPNWLQSMEVPPSLTQRFGNGESGSLYYAIWDPEGKLIKTSLAAKDIPDPISLFADDNKKSSDEEMKVEGQKPMPAPDAGEAAWNEYFQNTKLEIPTPKAPKIHQRGEMREAFVSGPFGIQFLVGKSIEPLKTDLSAWLGCS